MYRYSNCKHGNNKSFKRIAAASWVFIFFSLAIGCGGTQSRSSTSKKTADPVKEDFDWAMQRLRRAIETFTPPAGLGLRVKRKLSFEYHPPGDSNKEYTATVVVDSTSAYQPRQLTSEPEEEVEQPEDSGLRDLDGELDGNFSTKGEEDPTAFLKELPEETPQKSKGANPLVKAPLIKERTVFELVYRDERWQLKSQPEAKHEQLWFEYALQQEPSS